MSKFTSVLEAARGRDVQEEPAPIIRIARGRPKGKRSDPSFEQVTAYIRKDTYLKVKMSLLQEGGDRDFSDVVEELLSEFLRTQKLSIASTQHSIGVSQCN
jgi:hypothetical protein